MNKNEVEVKFPMTDDIFDLVVTSATSEEGPVVRHQDRGHFVVVYHDSEAYSAMVTRLSGLLKPLITQALGTLLFSQAWTELFTQARLHQVHSTDVTMPTPYGAMVTYHVGNETRH